MIINKVFRLKQPCEVTKGITLPSGQEIEIVMNVVYINGYPLPPNLQPTFMAWLKNNPNLFKDDTRQW